MSTASGNLEVKYPIDFFVDSPDIRLRALQTNFRDASMSVGRILRDNGLVESLLVHQADDGYDVGPRIYMGWILGIIVGTLAQIESLRSNLAWEAIPFGLEVEIWNEGSDGPIELQWTDRGYSRGGRTVESATPIRLPRYHVGSIQEYDSLVSLLIRDIMNAWHQNYESVWTVPWSELLPN